MTTQHIDPGQIKAGQRQDWDRAANGWRKWWETMERGAQHVSDRLVELAEIGPGHRVLDVATGIGEPAVTAARRVGPAGRVIATDQSLEMLAIARERATGLGLDNIDFREMDAEALDLPESSFDAVLSRWGLMFLPDVATALDTIRRLLVPDGRFAAAVWEAPPKVPMVSLAMRVIQEMFQLPPLPLVAPSPFSLSAHGVVEQAFTQAGFAEVRSESLTVVFESSSVEAYTDFLHDIAPPVNALLASQPVERQAEAWKAISEAARAYAAPDGTVRMPSETICVSGQRPAQ